MRILFMGTPEFAVYEDGNCMVSLAVTQHSGINA